MGNPKEQKLIEEVDRISDRTEAKEAVEYQEGRSALVIGMGLFGSSVARELTRLGWFVLAVDGDHSKVNSLIHEVSAVRVIDAVDLDVIQSLDPAHFDVCISAIGDENTHVITTTIHNLKLSGAQTIIARTINTDHNLMFTKLGCDLLLQPEDSYGVEFSRFLHGHSQKEFKDTFHISPLNMDKLQKHNLALGKPKYDVEQENIAFSYKPSLISIVFQLLIWCILLQYAYSLSVELDHLHELNKTASTTSHSYQYTFNILSLSLIIVWLFVSKIFTFSRK